MLALAESGTRSEVENEGAGIVENKDDLATFWSWFGGSIAVDPLRRPPLAYRGEHGYPERVHDANNDAIRAHGRAYTLRARFATYSV